MSIFFGLHWHQPSLFLHCLVAFILDFNCIVSRWAFPSGSPPENNTTLSFRTYREILGSVLVRVIRLRLPELSGFMCQNVLRAKQFLPTAFHVSYNTLFDHSHIYSMQQESFDIYIYVCVRTINTDHMSILTTNQKLVFMNCCGGLVAWTNQPRRSQKSVGFLHPHHTRRSSLIMHIFNACCVKLICALGNLEFPTKFTTRRLRRRAQGMSPMPRTLQHLREWPSLQLPLLLKSHEKPQVDDS